MRTGANISCSLVRPVKNRGFRLRKGPFCTSFPPRSAARSGPHSRSERNEDNRGLRPRGTLYFLAAKSTKNSPADASAYFVPSNVRNGRLFAGLQANRPRFLPLLAGTSFHGSGIGPGPFAAVLSFRPGKEANTRTKDVRPCSRVRMFAQNRTENRTESEPKLPAAMRIPVLNRAQNRTESGPKPPAP